MRILLVHNFYGSAAPSGENKVFEAEKAMLEKHGEIVDVYTRHSDEIRGKKGLGSRGLGSRGGEKGFGIRDWGVGILGRIGMVYGLVKGAVCTVGNPFAAWALGRKIRAFRPEVVHFHNQFPLISPLALWAAHRSGVKVVMTLHNYRTVCAAGVPMREGKVCRECFREEGLGSREKGLGIRGLGIRGLGSRGGEKGLGSRGLGSRELGVGSRGEVTATWRRAQAEKKVEECLAGVDEAAFDAALERLVEEKSGAGEYRFKRPEEKTLALDGARRFFREFSRKIVPLSDGRCVYFAPDLRARKRNVDNAVSWAEYAFHAVSNGGVKLSGKDYHERWYNPHKIPAFASIVTALNAENCFVRLSGVSVCQDAIVFAGSAGARASIQVVTRLDDIGNMDANLSEVTFTATSKGQKKLPRLVPLTEAVRTVAHHQTTAGSYPPDGDIIANPDDSRKGGLSVLPALRHRCYRGNLLATLPLAINIWLYRHCWAKWVDKFIVLSEFQRDRMIECGFPASKLVVKGNFVSPPPTPYSLLPTPYSLIPNPSTLLPNPSQRSGVVFVGRLSDEKGVTTLINAWRLLTVEGREVPRLTIIGDGVRRVAYESSARDLPIEFVGQKRHDDVLRMLGQAKALILPSEWWETFGLVVVEAAMRGTPAVVSNLGALPSIVIDGKTGFVFEAGNARKLAARVTKVLDERVWKSLSHSAFVSARELYGEDANYCRLREVYAFQ